jgi:hypothetical protein
MHMGGLTLKNGLLSYMVIGFSRSLILYGTIYILVAL